MIRVLAKTNRQWSPTPWWKHLLMVALAFLLATMESYGELYAELDGELEAWGIRDLRD